MRVVPLVFILHISSFILAVAGDFAGSAKGTSTANFLKLGVGARPIAMGEAYTAVADDAGALYWNTAGLTRVAAKSATFMHASYLESSSFEYGAYAQNLGDRGVLGLGIQYFSAGSLAGTDASGVDTGSFTPSNLAVTLGYARKVAGTGPLGGFSLGLGLKFIQSKIQKSASTEALDLGLLSPAYLNGKLTLGLAVTNLGGTLKFDSAQGKLPMMVKFGSSYRISDRWLAALDLLFPRDNKMLFGVGTEYIQPMNGGVSLAGRLGYNSRTAGDISGMSGLAYGLGFGFNAYSLDYALAPYGDLGTAQRLSLSYRFGGAAPEETRAEAPAPATLEEFIARAKELIEQKRWDEAKKDLLSAQAALPAEDVRRIFVAERLGEVSLQNNDLDSANRNYTEALDLAKNLGVSDPSALDARRGLIYCLELQGKLTDRADIKKSVAERLKTLKAK